MVTDEWDQTNLGEQVNLLTGFPFKSADYTEDIDGIPLIRGDNVVQGAFRWDDVKKWSRDQIENLSEYFLNSGDVVLAMDRPWIEAGLKYACVSEYDVPCLLVQRVSRLRAKDTLDQRFLRYVIGSPEFTNYVTRVQTGTAVPHISGDQIKQYRFLLPPLSEQHAIAGILGALDDKIELNRRMNHTLASMARAVFRQWFVEGEQINKWDELTWGEISTIEYGKSLSDYKDSNAPYVVYGTNGPIGRHTEPLYPSEGIIIGRKGAYRGIHYSPYPFFVIDTAFYLQPQKPFSMKWAYFELLRLDLNGMDSGSAIPSTSRTDFYNIPVFFPPQERMNSFEAFVAPLFTKIYANERESRTLASLRDSLLPKLMRGEVRVKDMEKEL